MTDVNETHERRDSVAMVKVLICGAAGWLGRAITDVMIESGFEVRAFDRDAGQWSRWDGIPSAGMNGRLSEQDSSKIKGSVNGRHVGNASIQRAIIGHGGTMEMCYGDITDYRTVAQLVDGVDAIIHATAYFPKASDDEMAWRVNCGGLWNVLDCARNSGRVRRVVHIGSCHTTWPGSTSHPQPGSVFFDGSVRRGHHLRTVMFCSVLLSLRGPTRFARRYGVQTVRCMHPRSACRKKCAASSMTMSVCLSSFSVPMASSTFVTVGSATALVPAGRRARCWKSRGLAVFAGTTSRMHAAPLCCSRMAGQILKFYM